MNVPDPPLPPSPLERFDVAVVTHNTDFLLHNLLVSIRERLPAESLASVHVWDNGSGDETLRMLDLFRREVPWLHVHPCRDNVYHGPALDTLLRQHCKEPWVLLLDSDTEVRSDFTPWLPPLGPEPPAFVGQIHPQMPQLYAYLAHLLVSRAWYLRLPPFRHHGAPGIDFFRAIEQRRIPYQRFRWGPYVQHFGQGTLRGIAARGETSNVFFRFASRESRKQDSPPERVRKEKMREALRNLLANRKEPAGPPVPAGDSVLPRDAETRVARVAEPAIGLLRRAASTLLHPPRERVLRKARRIGLVHEPEDLPELLRTVRRLAPRRVLDIGTTYGGSLFLWTRLAADDAVLISVDLPPWELDDPGEEEKVTQLRRFRRVHQSVHVLRKEWRMPATRDEVVSLLAGEPLDFLFWNGDLPAGERLAELRGYCRFVRPRGLVAPLFNEGRC